MRKVLIVGGAGYIGQVLKNSLGCDVDVRDNLIYGQSITLNPWTSFKKESAGNLSSIEGCTDAVVLSGFVGEPICKKYDKESWDSNVYQMIDLFHFLKGKGIGKVIFLSTCSVYGEIPPTEVADENRKVNYLGMYAYGKCIAEASLTSAPTAPITHTDHKECDYTPVILRLATVYGHSPRMRFDLTVNEFTRALAALQPLEVYDADTWRPYVHVEDVCKAIKMVLDAPAEKVSGQIFNVGSNEDNYTKRQIVELIGQQLPFGKRLPFGTDHIKFVEKPGADARNYRVNFDKIRDVLGFSPNHTVKTGINQILEQLKKGTYDDFKDNPNKYGDYVIHE